MLDFLDLLVKARDALRDSEAVRRYFSASASVVIIDEFQDTDPVRSRWRSSSRAGARRVGRGRARRQQSSIYRFRRAEVALFRRWPRSGGAAGARRLHLTQNFRSRAAILRFVTARSPLYHPLRRGGPARIRSDRPRRGSERGAVRHRSALRGAFAEGEACCARKRARSRPPGRGGGGRARGARSAPAWTGPAAPATVMAWPGGSPRCVPRGSARIGGLALHHRGASPSRPPGGARGTGRLRALDDPSDRVSLVAALRSSFCGVSDRDIVAYASPAGRCGSCPRSRRAHAGRENGGAGAGVLATCTALRTSLSVPALIERLYDETRILAALTGTRRGEAQVANLEKVVVLARKAPTSAS